MIFYPHYLCMELTIIILDTHNKVSASCLTITVEVFQLLQVHISVQHGMHAFFFPVGFIGRLIVMKEFKLKKQCCLHAGFPGHGILFKFILLVISFILN